MEIIFLSLCLVKKHMLLTLAGEERGDRRPLYQSNKELHEKF